MTRIARNGSWLLFNWLLQSAFDDLDGEFHKTVDILYSFHLNSRPLVTKDSL